VAQSVGDDAFLSYRHTMIQHLNPAATWLWKSGRFSSVMYIKPDDERLALKNEILMPFEYFELALAIWEKMEECDTFAYLDSEDYLKSVWTNLEIVGWQFVSDARTVVRVTVGRHGGYSADQMSLRPLAKAEKDLWGQIRRNLRPYALQNSSRVDTPYRGGKLARKRYLLPCSACREYTLINKRTTEKAAKAGDSVSCSHCGVLYEITSQGKYSKIRSRTPIVAKPLSRSREREPRSLTIDELTHLYAQGNPPPGIIDAGD